MKNWASAVDYFRQKTHSPQHHFQFSSASPFPANPFSLLLLQLTLTLCYCKLNPGFIYFNPYIIIVITTAFSSIFHRLIIMDGMYGYHSTGDYSDKPSFLMSPDSLILPSDYQALLCSSDDRFPVFGSEYLLSATPSAISSDGASIEDDVSAAIKAKIASHPCYPRLLRAYIDCQKVINPYTRLPLFVFWLQTQLSWNERDHFLFSFEKQFFFSFLVLKWSTAVLSFEVQREEGYRTWLLTF